MGKISKKDFFLTKLGEPCWVGMKKYLCRFSMQQNLLPSGSFGSFGCVLNILLYIPLYSHAQESLAFFDAFNIRQNTYDFKWFPQCVKWSAGDQGDWERNAHSILQFYSLVAHYKQNCAVLKYLFLNVSRCHQNVTISHTSLYTKRTCHHVMIQYLHGHNALAVHELGTAQIKDGS